MNYKEIYSKIDVMKILYELNIHGEIKGEQYVACCPMLDHKDKKPSWAINTKNGLWNCLGCGSHGNAIHLVERVLNLDRDFAIEKIKEWLEIEKDEKIYSPSIKELIEMLEVNIEGNEDKEDMPIIPLPRLSESNEEIRSYLIEKRNYELHNAHLLMNDFDIVYCSVGFYAGRIIIPIKDSEGKQVSFEARATSKEIKPKNIYPRGTQIGRLLFNHSEAKCFGTCCIVEGAWDVMKLYTYGLKNVVGLFGTNLSLRQAEILIRNYKKVIIMMDGDEAGRHAQDKIKKILEPYTEVVDVRLQYGDPDELSYEDLREIRRMYSI